MILSNDDRSKIRQDIIVAILGIAVGALTTFVTKFIEAEYQYQRNLKVVEYEDKCGKDVVLSNGSHRLECELSIQARGLKAIKGVELSVTSSDDSSVVTPLTLTSEPKFAPPDPEPQIKSNALYPGFKAVLLGRIKEPQRLNWRVAVETKSAIDSDSQIHRSVTVRDDDARIEEGGSWRWKRWIPFGILAVAIPLVISLLLLISLLVFRPQRERRSANEAIAA